MCSRGVDVFLLETTELFHVPEKLIFTDEQFITIATRGRTGERLVTGATWGWLICSS